MNNTKLFLLMCLVAAGCACASGQEAPPAFEEHRIEKTGEPCIEYEDGKRCTTLNLSWITFDDLPAFNDSITARVKGMLVDFEQPDTTGTLEELADAWFANLQEDAGQDTLTNRFIWVWDFNLGISVHDRRDNLLSLSEHRYIYTGGAHGLPGTDYLHWNLDEDREVTLDDLIIANQEEAFWSQAQEAHERWLDENDLDQDFRDFWPFNPTDVFYFGDDGLVLVYNVYEIGPYVMGPQELVIPWEQLEGVLELEYLPLLD